MARIFTCGFEENVIGTNAAMWTSTAGNAPTVGSTSPASGTYRMNTSALAGNSYATRNLSAAKTTGSLWTRFKFQTDDETPSADTDIISNLSSGSVVTMQVRLLTTGVWRLFNAITTTTVDSVAVASAGTWYRIETYHLLSDTVGDMKVRIYNNTTGALIEEIGLPAVEDTLSTNILGFRVGKTASAEIFSYDDFAINDEVDPGDGSQMTWPGPGRVYMLVPNSDVAITWEDDAGGTDNATFANIDGLPVAVDDTDYNAIDTLLDVADALGQEDRLGLTNLGAEVTADATITLADVYGRVGSGQTSAANMRFMLWDESGTLTNGPTCNANVATWKIVTTSEHLVYNATGKTKANFDSFNVGYEAITDVLALRPRRVAELWVNVEWTEAVSAITTEYVGPTAMQRQGGVMIGRRYV